MASKLLLEVGHVWRRSINTTTDPRVGSARDNGTATSVLRIPIQPSNSASFATLFMTFVPVSIYALFCSIAFLTCRRKFRRVYSPRTFLSSLLPHELATPLPSGWFNWWLPFWRTPDLDVLNTSSLDAFLFLRYLKILCAICVVGITVTWPVLLPLHANGGLHSEELNKLTFGNVAHVHWLYVHAIIAWLYFGFILFMVSRECVYFINIRQAYLLSSYYATRLSSRTVLFTSVPGRILHEKKLRRVFGDQVKNIWIPRSTQDLDDLVKERIQTAHRLEKAEIQLILSANRVYRQALKNGNSVATTSTIPSNNATCDPRTLAKELKSEISESISISKTAKNLSPSSHFSRTLIKENEISPGQSPCQSPCQSTFTISTPQAPPDINGSVAARWLPAEKRPTHRPLANLGKRVDTIKWTRERMKVLAPKIAKARKEYRKGKTLPIPAVFIEFHTLADAQSAYQTLAHHSPNHMRPEIVGIRPSEIHWPALYFKWWERIIRRFVIQGFVAVICIFWSLPAAFIGMASNIVGLSTKWPFLIWIHESPMVIQGLLGGLLPPIALSILMSLVPKIMRACARQSGVPTESKIELFVQNAYFVFQIVQVFLITTVTASASDILGDMIMNPMVAKDILSQNIPKASNFYVSYFILQGLAMSATRLVHFGSILHHQKWIRFQNNPRIMTVNYQRLRRINWGSIYPVITTMGVIAISYSLIAPIVLGVAAAGLSLIYVSYRYNLLYVYSSECDTRGLCYPRALQQTLTGVYLAEVCLIGLFGLKSAYGPLLLMIGLLVFTALVQISIGDALGPLLYNFPRTLAAEEELLRAGNSIYDAGNLDDQNDLVEKADPGDQDQSYDSSFDPSHSASISLHDAQSSRVIALEGAEQAITFTTGTIRSYFRRVYASSKIPWLLSKIDFWSFWITPPRHIKPNFVLKWLHPEIFEDYHTLRAKIPQQFKEYIHEYPASIIKDAYSPPGMRKRSPRIWIPRDVLGVSRQEVDHSSKVLEISDEGAFLSAYGDIQVELEGDAGLWVLNETDRKRIRF